MSFTDAVKTCISKYVVWEGRASRAEYWWFTLGYLLALFAAAILGSAVHSSVLGLLVILAGLLPALSVTIRRLHDTGRSGAWYWIALIPFVGGLVLFIFTLLPSDPRPNGYGAAPAAG